MRSGQIQALTQLFSQCIKHPETSSIRVTHILCGVLYSFYHRSRVSSLQISQSSPYIRHYSDCCDLNAQSFRLRYLPIKIAAGYRIPSSALA